MRPNRDTQFDNENGASIMDVIKNKLASSDNTVAQKIFSLFKDNKDDVKQVTIDVVKNMNSTNSVNRNQDIVDNMSKEQLLQHQVNDLAPNFMKNPVYSDFDQMVMKKRSEFQEEPRHKVLDNISTGLENAISPKSHLDLYPISPDKAYFEENSKPKKVSFKM